MAERFGKHIERFYVYDYTFRDTVFKICGAFFRFYGLF